MITKQQALKLTYRQILFHTSRKGSLGVALRARVNGKVKTWKSKAYADKFEIPMKYGLYECFYITNSNAADWTLDNSDEK
jgi:hypothetical protein